MSKIIHTSKMDNNKKSKVFQTEKELSNSLYTKLKGLQYRKSISPVWDFFRMRLTVRQPRLDIIQVVTRNKVLMVYSMYMHTVHLHSVCMYTFINLWPICIQTRLVKAFVCVTSSTNMNCGIIVGVHSALVSLKHTVACSNDLHMQTNQGCSG